MKNHAVTYKDQTINFVLTRKKVKNVNLKVRADSTVVVSANNAVPLEYIEQLVKKKGPWILKHLNRFAEINASTDAQQLLSGSILYYLGRPYSLQVFPAAVKQEVKINNGTIAVFVKDPDDYTAREKLVRGWFKEEGKTVFKHSLERIYPLVAGYGIEKPVITVRSMQTRWGSCSRKKQKITLNSELVRAQLSCIDYVVLHELAHFKHKNHDAAFYDFIAELMPDWKERKNNLKNIIAAAY